MIHSPTSTIKSQVLGTLKYVSFAALLSSTALVSQSNAQAFQPKYPNFAYFLDNFCIDPTSCKTGQIPFPVTSTMPSVGVIIGSDISPDVRQKATQYGHIVGYSDGFDNNSYGGSVAKWTDKSVTGQSLQDLFNDSNSVQSLSSDPIKFAKTILTIAGVTLSSFPSDNESIPAQAVTTNGKTYPGGGYVIWAQDIEKNNEGDNSASASTYIAIFWAGRTLLPTMKIIPVPSSYILKAGTGLGSDGKPDTQVPISSWGLNAIVNGGTIPQQNLNNKPDQYLKILNLKPSNTTDNIDLMSFLHSVTVNGKPLIDGFLGQQYSCAPFTTDVNNQYYCNDKNPSALPGEFSQGDTPVPIDKTLPYALLSAHDNPNQITLSWSNYPTQKGIIPTPFAITAPTKTWQSAYNGCLPFQAGVYWSNYNDDLDTFNPTLYLSPTDASSTSLASKNSLHSRRLNYGSFKLSVQIQGGSAGVNGSVKSTNTSISCGSQSLLGCNQSVGAYQTVTLVANPDPGRKFLYWTGADSCKGDSPTCSLVVKEDTQVGACFQ